MAASNGNGFPLDIGALGGLGVATSLQDIQPTPLIDDSEELYSAITSRRRRAVEIKLDKEEEDRLVNIVMNDLHSGISKNRQFMDNHVEFMRNWRGIPEDKKEHPLGKLAANVKVPFTSTIIEQWKSRFAKLLFDAPRIARITSLNPALSDDLSDTTDWFDYELREIVQFETSAEDILHYLLIDGICCPIPYYEVCTETVFSTREFERSADAIGIQIEQAIRTVFSGEEITQLDQERAGVFRVRFSRAEDAVITIILDEDCIILEIEQEKVTFDGVKIRVPSLEDMVTKNSNPDIDKVPFFALRMWMSVDEIKAKLGQPGGFKALNMEQQENLFSSKGRKDPELTSLILSKEQDLLEGTDSLDSEVLGPDDPREWIEIYRIELNYNIKGRSTPLIIWLAARSRTILRIERLEGFSIDGKRTPVKFDFIRVPDRFFSVGLCEWIRHVQTELDGIHNFRLDSALISTVPFGFYEPAAGMNFESIALLPGKMYPTRSIKSILFPQLAWNPIWGFQEEALVRKYGSELAGIGDPGTGSFTSKRVSASEFQGTLAAIDIRTEYIARGVLRAFKKLLTRIFMLYQRHAKVGRVYQIAGSGGETVVKTLDISRLYNKLQIAISNNIQVLSNQLERETSVMMLSTLLNQLLIQVGIVKPDTIYEAVKKMAKAHNYTDVPLHMPDLPPDSPPPLDEHRAMLVGKPVMPHLGENFNEHMQVHMLEMQHPDFELRWTNPLSRQMLQQHIQQTVVMQQQAMIIRQQQAMAAVQMEKQFAQYGINQPGQGAQGGSREEGVTTGPAESSQMI